MSAIPSGVRSMVRGRDEQRCVRCRMGARTEQHHRRGRSVADAHQHCPCNLILLCGWGNHTGDHGWAHSQPLLARRVGLVLPRSVAVPADEPLLWHGQWVRLTCTGHVVESQPPALL